MQVKGRSMLFDDIIGGMVAAMAMMLACLTIIFAQTVRHFVMLLSHAVFHTFVWPS